MLYQAILPSRELPKNWSRHFSVIKMNCENKIMKLQSFSQFNRWRVSLVLAVTITILDEETLITTRNKGVLAANGWQGTLCLARGLFVITLQTFYQTNDVKANLTWHGITTVQRISFPVDLSHFGELLSYKHLTAMWQSPKKVFGVLLVLQDFATAK